MADSSAVKPPAGDPKKGKPRAPHSKTRFPYYSLEESEKVPRLLHDRAGGACELSQLSGLLGTTEKSGAFLSRIGAARMFGLVDKGDHGRYRVTKRGMAIVAPVNSQQQQQARVDAFLAVELFDKVYRQFKGSRLPEKAGLRNLARNDYGIVEKRVATAVRVLLASAEHAGFFVAGGRERLVTPVGLNEEVQDISAETDENDQTSRESGANGDAAASGIDSTLIDPAILGLLRRLPPVGTPLPAADHKKLFAAFKSVVVFLYPVADDD